MLLADEEQEMLEGEYGLGVQRCMTLLVRGREAFAVENLVPVNLVHISINIPLGLVEKLTEGAQKTRAQSSLHAIFDPLLWRELYSLVAKEALVGGLGIVDEKVFSSRVEIFRNLGFLPAFIYLPYANGIKAIASGETPITVIAPAKLR